MTKSSLSRRISKRTAIALSAVLVSGTLSVLTARTFLAPSARTPNQSAVQKAFKQPGLENGPDAQKLMAEALFKSLQNSESGVGQDGAKQPIELKTFETFATDAKLSTTQRDAILKHYRRYGMHLASLKKANRGDLLERLESHMGALILSELNAAQAEKFAATGLPGSLTHRTASVAPLAPPSGAARAEGDLGG